jgi:hypothetical protein
MRRAAVVAGVSAVLLGPVAGVASAGAVATTSLIAGRAGSGGTWGKAIQVPGMTALDQGGRAGISAVSCASAGNCSAGGTYGRGHVFVVSQVNGTWGKAEEVPGTAALNTDGSTISSISCASAGNCSAGGTYYDGSSRQQVFVVSQVNGTWGTAVQVPGTAALNKGGQAVIASVSCASAGNCSAGGTYAVNSGHFQAFVVSQAHGTWGKAEEVPGHAALKNSGFAGIASVSCGAAGNCSAGGTYPDSSGHLQAFVVSQAHGTWGTAIKVPGTAALNTGGGAQILSVSCASAGNCSAGGTYADSSGHGQAFVVSQAHGTWGTAVQVPGTTALDKGGRAFVASVSCAPAGNCSAGGDYYVGSGHSYAFVVSQVNGAWGTAIEVPGTTALHTAGTASLTSASCGAAGNCSAGGYYYDNTGHIQGFVVSQAHGTWGKAIEVLRTASLKTGGQAFISSVSCASAGNCSAGGTSNHQAFVVSEK